MAKSLELNVEGGTLEACLNTPAVGGAYLCWYTNPGSAFGVAKNSPAVRRWLKRALARMEKDAARRK